jgi:hypothetical protein
VVQKNDRSYKEEIRELKENKKLAGVQAQELDQEIGSETGESQGGGRWFR